MGERRCPAATPVLDWRIRVENLRPLVHPIPRFQPIACAIEIALLDIGKRKLRWPIRIAVGRRREPFIKRPPGRTCDMYPHRIEDAPVALVNPAVMGVSRVERKLDPTDQLFVRPGRSKRLPASDDGSRGDRDACHFSECHDRMNQQAENRDDTT
jgi:hypothetical protein